MKFQFNWGTGIFITIVVFIAIMISIIVFSMNQQVNLVSPDYYPKGVDFDKQIEKSKNTNSLLQKINCQKVNDSLVIDFPEKFKSNIISGTIQFYFVTNYKMDITEKIKLNKVNKQYFLLSSFVKGRYILKFDWTDGEKGYYQEIDINL